MSMKSRDWSKFLGLAAFTLLLVFCQRKLIRDQADTLPIVETDPELVLVLDAECRAQTKPIRPVLSVGVSGALQNWKKAGFTLAEYFYRTDEGYFFRFWKCPDSVLKKPEVQTGLIRL